MALPDLRTWFASAVLGLVGCSVLVDTGGLEGGGGAGGSDAGSSSSASSSSSSGGPTGPDAAVAAASEGGGDALASSPCTTPHTVCADFDSASSLKSAFPDSDLGVGSVTVDAGSLLVTIPAGTDRPTTVSRTIPVAATGAGSIVCDFDYQRVDEVSNDANLVAILSFYAGTATPRHTFLELKEAKAAGRQYVELTGDDGGTSSVYPEFDRISKPGGWVHVRQTLRFAGKLGDSLQSVTRDGAVLSSTAQQTVAGVDVKSVTIAIGLVPIGNVADGWRVRFDSVVCDVTPP